MSSERKEFTSWWVLGLALLIPTVVVLGGVTFTLNSCGSVAGTVVDRKVQENSYQNSEARKTEIMTMEAQLATVEADLANPATPEATRAALRGQRRAINIRLEVARKKYDQVLLKQ